MGACNYYNDIKTDKDVGAAFAEVVEQAEYEHGHGGYSGTIAEKGGDGYILIDLPAGVDGPHDFERVLAELSYSLTDNGNDFDPAKLDGLEKQLVDTVPKQTLMSWVRAYDDKWGPAIAVKIDGGWAFFGYASS